MSPVATHVVGWGTFREIGHASIVKGWALTRLDKEDEGLALLQKGIQDWKAMGAEMVLPTYLALWADAYHRCDNSALALRKIDEAFSIARRNHEAYYDSELHRLRGTLLSGGKKPVSSAALDEAEHSFMRAIRIARARNLRPHEFRASTSLASLWKKRGKTKGKTRFLQNMRRRFPSIAGKPELSFLQESID